MIKNAGRYYSCEVMTLSTQVRCGSLSGASHILLSQSVFTLRTAVLFLEGSTETLTAEVGERAVNPRQGASSRD